LRAASKLVKVRRKGRGIQLQRRIMHAAMDVRVVQLMQHDESEDEAIEVRRRREFRALMRRVSGRT